MKIDLLIFDFDGTIVDSKSVYYKSISKHLKQANKEDIDKAVDLGLKLGGILKHFGFSWFYRWYLKRKIMNDVLKSVRKIKKCEDVSALKNLKVKKILISNSFSEFVMPVLKHLKIKKYFKEIYCGDEFENKAGLIKKLLKEKKIDKKNVLYIGDRVVDIETARQAGCLSLVVSNKYSWDSRKELLKEKPDFIINKLKGLEEIVE